MNSSSMSLAQAIYDGIGNEIFRSISAELRANPLVRELSKEDQLLFEFEDGSILKFKDGFSHATGAKKVDETAAALKQTATQSLAQKARDGIGNEVFATIAAELRADQSVRVLLSTVDHSVFGFEDGSTLSFEDGFVSASAKGTVTLHSEAA